MSLVNIDKRDRQANGLQENTGSVAYIVLTFIFVFLVLFVTLLGLVVTIMWCCVTTTKSRRLASFDDTYSSMHMSFGVVDVYSPFRAFSHLPTASISWRKRNNKQPWHICFVVSSSPPPFDKIVPPSSNRCVIVSLGIMELFDRILNHSNNRHLLDYSSHTYSLNSHFNCFCSCAVRLSRFVSAQMTLDRASIRATLEQSDLAC